MKSYLFTVLMLVSMFAHASERAVTDEGRVVLLNTDGTWQFEGNDLEAEQETAVNDHEFKRDPKSVFGVKSAKNDSQFWVNPKEWIFKKNEDGGDVEYTFQKKGTDLYGMSVTEQIQMDLPNLAKVALENAKGAAPDARVVKQEYRTVNGLRVLYMEIRGTIQGIDFTYLGHYYTGEGGTTQHVAYTGSNLVPKYRDDIDRFLNGLSLKE